MERDAIELDYDQGESSSPPGEVKTVLLVGRTGKGKRATGNSILGRRAFRSMVKSAGVTTSTCEMHTTSLENGQALAVIDTRGLFDCSSEPEVIGKEIAKCIIMAKDGINAVLLVVSVKTRFSREEEAVVQCLSSFFGPILDCMIVVFTGGDENYETLDNYLCGTDCPDLLKETLRMCGNRHILFNNKTKDEAQKSEQGNQLLALVYAVVDQNGGKPYIDKQFVEMKEGVASEVFYDVPAVEVNSEEEKFKLEKLHKSYEEHLKRITETVGLKLKESSDKLAQQIAEQENARLKAEIMALSAQVLKLKESSDELAQQIAELKLKESSDKLAQQIAEQENAQLKAEIMALSAQMKSNDEIYKMRLEFLETAHQMENDNQRQQQPQIVSSSPPSEVKTIVLVGRSGVGKSATGNSILGREAFESRFSRNGVTETCEMHTTVLENGQKLAVVDTPGLFGFFGNTEFIGREIAKCIDSANDGLHAIVLVLPIRYCFSRVDEDVVQCLCSFFGLKIIDYMIVLFTGGDELEDDGGTLDDYLGLDNCPESLKETLRMCGYRRVVFNNRTEDEAQKSEQRKQLLGLVDAVIDKNCGIPYTEALFCRMEARQLETAIC